MRFVSFNIFSNAHGTKIPSVVSKFEAEEMSYMARTGRFRSVPEQEGVTAAGGAAPGVTRHGPSPAPGAAAARRPSDERRPRAGRAAVAAGLCGQCWNARLLGFLPAGGGSAPYRTWPPRDRGSVLSALFWAG